MPKYRIWCQLTAQHGEVEEEIEAADISHAEDAAYEMLLQELDSEANWGAEELVEDEKEEKENEN